MFWSDFMKDNKLLYILIFIGIILIFAVGILIGLNIQNNNKKEEVSNTTDTSKELDYEVTNDDTLEDSKEETSSNKENTTTSNPTSNSTSNNTTSKNTTSTNATTTTSQTNTTTSSNTSTDNTLSTKDTTVLNSLNETLNIIESSKSGSTFTKSAKATFINIVDFLFYDGTIKGITFKELTDNGKQKVLEVANKIDNAIEKKSPGYKENISDKVSNAYKNASLLIKKGASNLDVFLNSKLDDADYNSIIYAKDELITYTKNAVSFITDAGSSLFKTSKNKLSKWYQNYKNS
jgi:hypothetical protein